MSLSIRHSIQSLKLFCGQGQEPFLCKAEWAHIEIESAQTLPRYKNAILYSHDKHTISSRYLLGTIACTVPTHYHSGNECCAYRICKRLFQDGGVGKASSMITRVGLQALVYIREKRICHLGKSGEVGLSEKVYCFLRIILWNLLWIAEFLAPLLSPFFHREVWGGCVVFRFCVNRESWAGGWDINGWSVYRSQGTVSSLGNPHLAFCLTCNRTVQLSKRRVERVLRTSSCSWKEQTLAVKRPCRIMLSNLEIYPIFSVLYQSRRQKHCRGRLKRHGMKSNLTDVGFWNPAPGPEWCPPLRRSENSVGLTQGH